MCINKLYHSYFYFNYDVIINAMITIAMLCRRHRLEYFTGLEVHITAQPFHNYSEDNAGDDEHASHYTEGGVVVKGTDKKPSNHRSCGMPDVHNT